MLENRISELKQSIDKLTEAVLVNSKQSETTAEVLGLLVTTLLADHPTKSMPEKPAKKEKPKAEPKQEQKVDVGLDDISEPAKTEPVEKPKAEPKLNHESKASAEVKVSTQDIIELCIEIVKNDRAKRDIVRETIVSFGGKVVGEVDPAKLPELKAALEVL